MLSNKGERGQKNREEIGAGATDFIFLAASPLVRPARQNRHATQATTSSTQGTQTCTEAATKYYNYTVNETDEEREHWLPTLPKATRLDQATLIN